MKRNTLGFCGAVVVLAAIAGCGQKNEDATSDPSRGLGAPGRAGVNSKTGAPLLAAPGAGQAAPEVSGGTSAPPTVAEWQGASSANTVGANSAPKDCELKVVREWLKVNCTGKITQVTNMDGFGRKGVDYFELVTPGRVADFVVRLKKGGSIKARILREGAGNSASLFVNWPSSNPKPSIVALQIFNG